MSTTPAALTPETVPSAPTSTPEPQAPSVTPTPAPASTPQSTDRNAIYSRYYADSPQPPATQEPVPAAQAEPAPSEPVPPEPEPTAVSAPDPAERISQLESQLAQVVGVLTQLAQPQQTPAAPASAPSGPSEDWLELLRQGKKDEAEQVLFKKFSDQTVQESTTQALELFRVESEINSFVNDLRGKNPDLTPFEEYIGYTAQQRLQAAIAAGQIKDTRGYVEHYKNAVNAAVKDARNIVQQVRAAEKTQSQVTKREVISTTPVPATAPDVNRGAPSKPEPKIAQTPAEYFEMRRKMAERRAGMF